MWKGDIYDAEHVIASAYVADRTSESSSSPRDPDRWRPWDDIPSAHLSTDTVSNTASENSSSYPKEKADSKTSQQPAAAALATHGNPAFKAAADAKADLKTAEAAVKVAKAKLELAEAEAALAAANASAPASKKLAP